jgi:hypothetical protein
MSKAKVGVSESDLQVDKVTRQQNSLGQINPFAAAPTTRLRAAFTQTSSSKKITRKDDDSLAGVTDVLLEHDPRFLFSLRIKEDIDPKCGRR